MIGGMEHLRDGTMTNYLKYAVHIGDAVGHMSVKMVQAYDVEKMDRANRAKMTKVVSNAILTLLNKLYKRLIATRVVDYNPVAAYMEITPPKARGGKALRAPVALDPGMIKRVLKELDGDPYQIPILFLFTLGFRMGELRGLRHANLFDDHLSIVEQRRPEDPFTATPLKTKDEIGEGRDLPYPKRLQLLVAPGDDLVFPSVFDGAALRSPTVRTHLNAALKRAKVQHIHLHDCRHSAATGLLILGCPERFVAEFLGHEAGGKSPLIQYQQTSHYARPNADALRPWVEKWLDAILPESLKKKLEELLTGT